MKKEDKHIIGGNATNFLNIYKPELSLQHHSELQGMLKDFAVAQVKLMSKTNDDSYFFKTARQLIDMYKERLARSKESNNYLESNTNEISINVLEHLLAIIKHNDK